MLGEKLIKIQIKNHVRIIVLKYVKNDKDVDEMCECISQLAIEFINYIGMKQFLRLLWYAKKSGIFKVND